MSEYSTVIPNSAKFLLKLSIWQFKESLFLIETIPGFIFGPPLKIKFLKKHGEV
jgi:hypothetical protein